MNKISRRLQADWPTHMSYDKRDNEIEKFYSSVEGVTAEPSSIFYRKRQIDIFLLAMAIGKEQNAKKPVKEPSQSIRRDALTEDEVWLMCCVALAEDNADLNILAHPANLIKTCEEYANGGIKSLILQETLKKQDNKQYEEFLEQAISKLQKDE